MTRIFAHPFDQHVRVLDLAVGEHKQLGEEGKEEGERRRTKKSKRKRTDKWLYVFCCESQFGRPAGMDDRDGAVFYLARVARTWRLLDCELERVKHFRA